MIDAYILRKELLKYYIIPNVSNLPDKLPYHNNFLSFWFKMHADITLKAMNAAFREGYRCCSFFGRDQSKVVQNSGDKWRIEPVDL